MSAAGLLLLTASVGGAAATLVAALRWKRHPSEAAARLVRLALLATFASLTATLALLVAKFLLVDVSTYYVWRYTDAAHPWYYRLSGLWAGQPGTLVLWAWYAAGGLLVLHLRGKPDRESLDARALATGLVAILVGLLVVIALQQGLFDATSDYRVRSMPMGETTMTEYVYAPGTPGVTPADVAPQGLGLNPLLLTPFMVIHPWIEFAAYGMVTLLYGLLLAQLLTKDDGLTRTLLPLARATWIVYTTAIALGALWAYYTLSFGGFWAWDPVETANLLPWLALTAYLHVAPLQKRHSQASTLAPILGILAFLLTLLATFLTRSGVWNGSVHAFITEGDLDVTDAGQRLATIIGQDRTMAQLLSLILGAAILVNIVLLHRERRARRAPVLTLVLALQWALLAWSALGPRSLLDATLLVARASPLGYALTTSLLAAIALLGPGAYLYLQGDDRDAPRRRLDHRALLPAAAVTLLLIAAVSLVLLLRGVNGTQRIVYDQRAPLFALALSGLLTFHFLRKSLTTRQTILALGLAAVAGAAGARAWPEQPLVALAAPFVLLALGSLLVAHERSAPPGATAAQRAARMLLTVAGILGFLTWANPPAELQLLAARVPIAPAFVIVGLAASAANLVAAALVANAAARGVARALAVLGIAAYGGGIGALLSVVAIILVALPSSRTMRRPWRADVHRGALTLLHASVLLAMVGYGLSTYLATEQVYTTEAALELGQPSRFGAYALTFTGSDGVDADGDGVYENVDVYILVHRGDELIGNATMSMFFVASKEHYDPSTYVLRGTREDVYFNANFQNAHAMYSETDGWTRGHGPTTEVHSAEISKLAMNVRVLPYTSLLWAGILLGILSMAARTLARPTPPRSATALASAEDATPS